MGIEFDDGTLLLRDAPDSWNPDNRKEKILLMRNHSKHGVALATLLQVKILPSLEMFESDT